MPELYLSYLIIFILIVIIIYQSFNIKFTQSNNLDTTYEETTNIKKNDDSVHVVYPPRYVTSPTARVVNMYNKMRNYDYRSYDDPLTPPEKRHDSDLPPQIINPDLYNIYTNGGPGIYKKMGYVKTDAEDVNQKYKYMNLIGRQKYEGSNQYQYYLVSTDRNDNIKIDLPQIRKELDSGDQISASQLTTGKYDVFIDKNIDYVYSPVVY
jgi:hypothetical protein